MTSVFTRRLSLLLLLLLLLLRLQEAAPAAVRGDVGRAGDAVALADKALLEAAVGEQHVAERERRLDAVAQERAETMWKKMDGGGDGDGVGEGGVGWARELVGAETAMRFEGGAAVARAAWAAQESRG